MLERLYPDLESDELMKLKISVVLYASIEFPLYSHALTKSRVQICKENNSNHIGMSFHLIFFKPPSNSLKDFRLNKSIITADVVALILVKFASIAPSKVNPFIRIILSPLTLDYKSPLMVLLRWLRALSLNFYSIQPEIEACLTDIRK